MASEGRMAFKPITTIAALAVLAMPTLAAAQSAQVGEQIVPAPHRAPPRIEIRPPRLLYRRCTDWYELQYRPSGTVLYPGQHCWWVRG